MNEQKCKYCGGESEMCHKTIPTELRQQRKDIIFNEEIEITETEFLKFKHCIDCGKKIRLS